MATALANDSPIDEQYLERTGVLPKLDGWRDLANEFAGLPVDA